MQNTNDYLNSQNTIAFGSTKPQAPSPKPEVPSSKPEVPSFKPKLQA